MTNPIDSTGNTIRFQEYLGDVRTSNLPDTFNRNDYIINAANLKTFPFLSQLAANYEQYELQGLLFQFKSTSADALSSVNTALGTVMMGTQYDINDQPFASKSEMLNYEYASSGKPSENITHMIECDPHQTSVNLLYTLHNATQIPQGADPRLYNLGRFSIATTGFQGTRVNIGELHVTYQVRLLKPKLFDTLGLSIAHYSAVTPIGIPPDNANPFGNTRTVNSDTIGMQITNNSLLFPPSGVTKYYRVQLSWVTPSTSGWTIPTYITSPDLVIGKVAYYPQSGASVQSKAIIMDLRQRNTAEQTSLQLIGINLGQGGQPCVNLIEISQMNPIDYET
jgi:hypothetical protein